MAETKAKEDRSTKSGPPSLLAEFESAGDLLHACEQMREAGYKKWDAHSPFPVHGLDRAMGLRPSRLPWIVLVLALAGAAAGMGLQGWVSAIDYPLIISGKPFFSWQAFVPITFEFTILFGAIASVFGMLMLNRLPRWHDVRFTSKRFEKVTDDRFFIFVDGTDPRFDMGDTRELLEEAGAAHVEKLSEREVS
jgi:hypothetical protein